MPERSPREQRLDDAIEALSDPERFRAAEAAVAAAAPRLQGILARALAEGGWLAESHEEALRRALDAEDAASRETAVRSLLAEEARMGMLVGVAVGWALHEELETTTEEDT